MKPCFYSWERELTTDHIVFLFQRDKSQLELVIVCLLYYQVYRKCYGEHVGFKMFMDAWLLSLARKVSLGSNFMSSKIICKLSLKEIYFTIAGFYHADLLTHYSPV